MNKKMNNFFKKATSAALAGAMVLSMGMPTKAATGDVNFTVYDTEFSVPIEAGKSVTLKVGPANSHYSYTGFDSASDAVNKMKYSYNTGEEKIESVKVTSEATGSTYASVLTVKAKNDNNYGPTSIHTYNTDTNAYVDLTVYREALSTKAAVTIASEEAVDLTEGVMYEYGATLEVKAADADTTDNPFKGSKGTAQSYPTAADALHSLAVANGLTLKQYNGYTQAITDSYGTKLEEYVAEGNIAYGWNYCVIRNGEKVAAGDVVSASVLEVKNGDAVYWAFGTMEMAKDYFDAL